MSRRPKSAIRLVAEPLLVAVALAFAVRATMRIYSIPSASMNPTLSVGDHILVTPYRTSSPERGDVVVFRSPASAGEASVKRVVAIPGDLIDGVEGRVRIGGRTLSEPYLRDRAASGAIAAQLIPSGFLFVMGDNRADSLDSRHWGILPETLVVGRARMVIWSSNDGADEHGNEAHASPMLRAERSISVRPGRIFKWID